METRKTAYECRNFFTRNPDHLRPPRHPAASVQKVIHVFQLRKGSHFNAVQAGLVFTLAAMVSACSSEQPAPAGTGPTRVAATAGGEHDQADLPVITISAHRE
jgi:hypothetical protein